MTAIEIAGRVYPTKGEARARCRQIVTSVLPGQQITNPDDLAFVNAVIRLHPSHADKIGVGIRAITVQINRPFKTLGFWIERLDGTRTDISYLECLTPSNNRAKVLNALRNAIADQRTAVKAAAFAGGLVCCPYTGQRLTPDTAHVDHAPPATFESLAGEFVELEGGWGRIRQRSSDAQIGSILADERVRLRWQRFHLEHAELRVVSIEANLSIIPRESRA